MLKPPVGFRGNTGIGALTGLSGVGEQDKFIHSPEGLEYSYVEYTQSTPYYRFYKPVETRFLGQEIRYAFKPKEMGDLLTGLMLKFKFPQTTSSPAPLCLKNIGLSMIKKVDFYINGQSIQTLKGEWMSIYESMYSTSQKRTDVLGTMYNFGFEYNVQPRLYANDSTQNLFFPLPFFFNRHYVDSNIDTSSFRAPLPLCSLYNSEIIIAIQFLSLSEIVSDTSGFASDADLTDFKFVTQEITLTEQERLMLKSVPQRYPIEKINSVENQFDVENDTYYYRYYFNSYYPCRAIFWTFTEFTDNYNPYFYTPLLSVQINTLNKTDRNQSRKPLFVQEYQSYLHNFYNDGSFYGYSFSENPLQVVEGDYEFKAPRPQSAYIDMYFNGLKYGFEYWSDTFSPSDQNYTIDGTSRILLNTSVGLGGSNTLLSLRLQDSGTLMTNTARVGISVAGYSNTSNDGNPPSVPYKMRFEPWNGSTSGYIKITPTSKMNINTFLPLPETLLLTTYYLSTNTFVVKNGIGGIE